MKTDEKQTKEQKIRRRFAVQDEGRLYFTLQIVFAVVQILLAYVAFGEKNIAQGGLALFALFGIVLVLIAAKGWQSRGMRILGRTLAAMAVVGFAVILVGDVFTTKVSNPIGTGYVTRRFGDYMGQLASYFCLYMQPIVLFLFPAFAIAARRLKKTADIRLLRVISWLMVAFSIGTLWLSYEALTRLDYSATLLDLVSNRVLLYAYLFFTVASLFSVFMLYPYGVSRIKSRVEALRAKQPDVTE